MIFGACVQVPVKSVSSTVYDSLYGEDGVRMPCNFGEYRLATVFVCVQRNCCVCVGITFVCVSRGHDVCVCVALPSRLCAYYAAITFV
jgi:hypothetical protein